MPTGRPHGRSRLAYQPNSSGRSSALTEALGDRPERHRRQIIAHSVPVRCNVIVRSNPPVADRWVPDKSGN